MLLFLTYLAGALLGVGIGKLINNGVSSVLKFFIKTFEIGIDKEKKMWYNKSIEREVMPNGKIHNSC